MMESDAAIVGGGVVGLACAAALARAGKSAVLLERHRGLGTVTTSRSSEVIHAGLYYRPGSLKATTCVRGAALLYAWCASRSVPHARCGKIVVAATDAETPALEALADMARANGATVELVGGDRVAELEPNVRAAAGLVSPATGIVDSHALVASLAAEFESHGGVIARGRRVVAVEPDATLVCDGPVGLERVRAARVVNAAGLWADGIAAMFGVALPQRFVKGSYFRVKRPLVRALVYPVPPADGMSLGVHATINLAGHVRLGPDAQAASSREDYDVDEARAGAFFASASRWLQNLRIEDLAPDTAGVRPKVASGDFEIRSEGAAVHLAGIESPGLTAALAIGERVAMLLS